MTYSQIPVPDSIPVHPLWFEALDLLTFALHLLVVNLVLGALLLSILHQLIGLKSVEFVSGRERSWLPMGFALAINLGVAPLLFVQVLYGHLLYTSSVLMALWWILVIPVLILAYYGAYAYQYQATIRPRISRLALFVAGICVLWIAFMLVNNMTLMLQPERWGAYFQNRSGTLLNLGDPTLWPRYAHFVVASVAVAALFASFMARFRRRDEEAMVRNLKVVGVATAIQMAFGLWFLVALPRPVMMLFMGGNLGYTVLLMGGILLGIGVLVSGLLGKLWPTAIHLVATFLLMVISRANLRSGYLAPHFTTDSLTVARQTSPLFAFLAVLVVGLVAVAYMVRMAWKTTPEVVE